MPLSGPLRALLRLRFLVPVLVGALAGAGAAWMAPPRYRAVAILSVEGDPAPGASLEDEIFSVPHLEMLAQLDPYPGTEGVLERLRLDLAVRIAGAQTLSLEYEHADPQKAADIVNKLAARLAEPVAAAPEDGALEARLAEARRELEQKEEERRRFQESHAASLAEQREAAASTLAGLRAERQAVEARLQEARAAQEAAARKQAAAASPTVDPDSEARERLRNELAQLRDRYTEDHPDIRKLRAQLAELELRAPAPPPPTPVGMPAGLQALHEQARALDARISDAEAGIEQPARTAGRGDALAELEAAKKRYLELLNQRMTGRLQAPGDQFRRATLSFRILASAQPPERPFTSDRRVLLLGGLALGLVGGFALTLIAAWRSDEPAFEPPPPSAPQPPRPPRPPPHVDPGAARARPPRPAPSPAAVATSHEPATPDLDRFHDTAVIPAGPGAAPASSTPAPDLLEPGSIFWRTPRPRRASGVAEDAAEPSRPAEPAASAPVEAPPVEDAAALLEPGSVFWPARRKSTTDTQPVPGSGTPGPLLGDQLGADEPAPSEPTAPKPEITPPLPEPPPQEPPVPVVEPPPPAPPAPVVEPPPETPPVPETAAPAARTPPAAFEPTAPAVEGPLVAPEPAAGSVVRPPAAEPTPTIVLPVARPAAPEAAPAGPALVVVGGLRHGSVLSLPASSSERLIGAASYCHLRLDLHNVDPVHARVVSDTYGLSVADAGSATGTYVNGRRIAGRYPLKDGDEVSLGPPGAVQSASLVVRVPPVEKSPLAREPLPSSLDRADSAETDSARALAKALMPPPPRSHAPLRPRAPLRPLEPPGPAPRGRRGGGRRSLAVGAALATVLAGGLAAWSGLLRSAPVVADVSPRRVRPGQTLTLSGSGFEAAADRTSVRLGSDPAHVVSGSPSRLEVALPRSLSVPLPATLPLVVEVNGRLSNPVSLDVAAPPRVARLEPGVARAGEDVSAALEPATARAESVHVAGVAAPIVGSQPGEVRFTVPPVAEAAHVPVDVWVAGGPAARAYLAVGRLPLVAEVMPPRGPVGERVVLRGFGFHPDPAENTVRFGKAQALVLAAAPEELTVSAPPAEPVRAGQVELPITVESQGAVSSSPVHYTLLDPPSGHFLPRFFAAPVPELPGRYHAFVSNELGPVMLLTGPEGEASTAERAARVARVLNELVEAAAKPLVLAFEIEPAPSVALAGGSHVVATATPTDALGYEGLWSRLGRRGSATPNSVATFWTALLRDQLSLFVQHQRPTHVLELSARGQVLADLYAQSRAAAGGRKGVPTDLVSRLRAPLAPALREMALLLPQPGESNPGASLVGRWQGTMEEGDRGALPIQVRLFFQGRRLAGTLTRHARGVSGEVRLRDVAYESGSLSFSLLAGNGVLRFRGSVRDDAMAGLISGGTDASRTVGVFTLRFAE